jgi:hypothetical protein
MASCNAGKRGGEPFAERQGLAGPWLRLDSAMTKAPLGGSKPEPNPPDRAKSGVKRSLLIVGHGVPMGLAMDGANRLACALIAFRAAGLFR